MKFIHLSGAGRSGKSTVAGILFDVAYEHNYIPVVLPFAKALKEEAEELGYTKETNPEEYRIYCQKWGAGRREEDPDYWVKKVFKEIEEIKVKELELAKTDERFEHLIIQDDVRYTNEIAFGRTVEAYQIFITAGERDLPELFSSWRKHESESLAFKVEIADTDYTKLFHEFLLNDGSLEDLTNIVRERFITWVSTNDHSFDPISKSYRKGEEPSTQFIHILLERMHGDEETDDSDS